METIIKVRPEELNAQLLSKIKEFIGSKENVDVTISLREVDSDYVHALDQSMAQAEAGDLISFTMEQFLAYQPLSK